MTQPAPAVFLVVPAYNPGEEFALFLPDLAKTLADSGLSHAVLVVDDGSAPEPARRIADVCARISESFPALRPPLVLPTNAGKGAAILTGWSQAELATPWLGFVDADGSVPAKEVVRVFDVARATGSTVGAVLASRRESPDHRVERRWHRHYIGRVFAALTTWWVGLPIHDTQCGLKFVRTEAFQGARIRIFETRFAFDVDLLCALRSAGYGLMEEPIDWVDRGKSTVRLWRDAPAMLLGLLRIRSRVRAQKAHGQSVRTNP